MNCPLILKKKSVQAVKSINTENEFDQFLNQLYGTADMNSELEW